MNEQQQFKLTDQSELTITVTDNDLIMLHGMSFSGQFDMNTIGIKLDKQPKNIKIGFLSHGENYFCFYFELDQEKPLKDFFGFYGFYLDTHVF